MKKIKFYTFLLSCLFFIQSLSAQTAFLPDYFSRSLNVADLQTNAYLGAVAVGSGSNAITVSPDGLRAYVAYYDFDNETTNTISVIDGKSYSILKNITVNSSVPFVSGIDITPDGSKVFFATNDTIFALNTKTLQIDARVSVGSGSKLRGVAVSHDGTKVYAGGVNNIYVVNTATYAVEPTIVSTVGQLNQMVVSADDKTIYATTFPFQQGVYLVDVASGNTTTIGTSADAYSSVIATPDNKRLYATNLNTNAVDVIDITSASVISSVAVGNSPNGIDISNDGSSVFVVNLGDGTLSVISTATNTLTSTINTGGLCYALGGFTSTNQVFPVHLGQFTASLSGTNVGLQWKTLNETNTSYFQVERSTDGIHFTAIGKIEASGNSSVAKNYSYSDLNVSSLMSAKTLYYRIRIVDKDGSATTSNIQPVTSHNNAIALSLLPNPVKDILSISAVNYTGKVNVVVADVNGRQLLVQNRMLDGGATTTINVSALQSGTYFIRIEGTNFTVQKKFIKE